MGAVFGLNYGWEHPLYYGDARGRRMTERFHPAELVGTGGPECQMLREHAGIIDISNFAKYRCKGRVPRIG